ncbi:MAG: hypothetical protein ACO3TI_07540 [Aquiluna sp.]
MKMLDINTHQRLLIDRAFLGQFTAQAHEQYAKAQIELELAQLEVDNAHRRVTEGQQFLHELEFYHREHVKEIKPKDNA